MWASLTKFGWAENHSKIAEADPRTHTPPQHPPSPITETLNHWTPRILTALHPWLLSLKLKLGTLLPLILALH